MFSRSVIFFFCATLLSGCGEGGAVDTARALWKFHQDFPDVSVSILLDINEDERRVPEYDLPPLLHPSAAESITSADQWQRHREVLLQEFSEHIYGSTPYKNLPDSFRLIESSELALNGKAVRKQLELDIGGHKALVLIYTPSKMTQPAPAFLALNFRGNHTISDDSAVLLPKSWVPIDEEHGVLSNQATEANRGQRARRWPVETIIDRGYALVTAYYGDFYPDHRDGRSNSVHGLFDRNTSDAEWGAIGAWSWGMSRILDHLEVDEHIDASRVISMGHSRLGKSALWAAAQDQRFAAAISNNSGAVGAALSRRQFGETVKIITAMFPYWFTDEFSSYAEQESRLPVDQHQLIALMAPRPVYVASASKDLWADPRGEFLATRAAVEVYHLFGISSSDNFSTMPVAGEAIAGPVSYHLRAGKHDLLEFDWRHYLNFADRHLRRYDAVDTQTPGDLPDP